MRLRSAQRPRQGRALASKNVAGGDGCCSGERSRVFAAMPAMPAGHSTATGRACWCIDSTTFLTSGYDAVVGSTLNPSLTKASNMRGAQCPHGGLLANCARAARLREP
ncbi:hypothetical protein BV20DRAFT_856465 [Pilatotrama ljubarskyi]|nr:hypothetical protein BV20DRAFT_168357 [Pilatotrama ljubarskyi]KAI0364535.1 hypothetical protein BV20DRAFT_856465 [Pilatotrama ljubarskyi]